MMRFILFKFLVLGSLSSYAFVNCHFSVELDEDNSEKKIVHNFSDYSNEERSLCGKLRDLLIKINNGKGSEGFIGKIFENGSYDKGVYHSNRTTKDLINEFNKGEIDAQRVTDLLVDYVEIITAPSCRKIKSSTGDNKTVLDLLNALDTAKKCTNDELYIIPQYRIKKINDDWDKYKASFTFKSPLIGKRKVGISNLAKSNTWRFPVENPFVKKVEKYEHKISVVLLAKPREELYTHDSFPSVTKSGIVTSLFNPFELNSNLESQKPPIIGSADIGGFKVEDLSTFVSLRCSPLSCVAKGEAYLSYMKLSEGQLFKRRIFVIETSPYFYSAMLYHKNDNEGVNFLNDLYRALDKYRKERDQFPYRKMFEPIIEKANPALKKILKVWFKS